MITILGARWATKLSHLLLSSNMVKHRKYKYAHLLSTNVIPMPTEIVLVNHGIEVSGTGLPA